MIKISSDFLISENIIQAGQKEFIQKYFICNYKRWERDGHKGYINFNKMALILIEMVIWRLDLDV